MTADKHEYLEQGGSRRTREWLDTQSEWLRVALYRRNDRPTIARLANSLLAATSMDIPFCSAAQRSVFGYRPADKELPLCCWREGSSGKLTVLASPFELGGQHTTPVPLAISTDGERAVIGWRTECRDELRAQIVELDTGRVLEPTLPPYEVHRTLWDCDLRGYFYVRAASECVQLLYQSIGDSASSPVLIRDNLPARKPHDVCLMRFFESPWLLLSIRSPEHRCAFDYYIMRRDPSSALRCLWKEWPHKTTFCALGDTLFVLTAEQAPKMRVLRLTLTETGECTADVLVPEGPYPVTSMHLAGETLLLRTATTPWTTQLVAYSLDGKELELKGLPSDGTIEGIQAEAGGSQAYIEASAIGRRPTIYRLDTQTRQAKLHFQTFSRLRLPAVETVTTWYVSRDGTRVPIRISRRTDIPPNRPVPTMLTTYGGFGVVDTMRYTNRSALWLLLGGLYVHVGVRGGGELGAEWHQAGKLRDKQNTFSDFIAAAEWLFDHKYTTPDKLAIVGGSNAGLIVATAMTMRPELFAAVVCSGPLLDMLRYHKFAGGAVGLPEFGSPDNAEDAAVLRAYSPYHNVREGVDYPPVLFISGDADTRCDPMHVRKMVARMQQANPGGKPVLLDYRPNKGHSGVMPLPDRIETLTNQFIFLVDALKLRVGESGQFECYFSEHQTPA